jgi:hypothetical protein
MARYAVRSQVANDGQLDPLSAEGMRLPHKDSESR